MCDIIDCNTCEWLDLTEEEQKKDENKYEGHTCTYYGERVIHRANTRVHNAFLYACSECNNESNVHYQKK